MKPTKHLAIVAAAVIAVSGSVRADLIDNGDWTTDTATHLDWLDITLTRDKTVDDVLGGFGGYVSQGWQIANASQVCSLFGALGDRLDGCGLAAITFGELSLGSIDQFGAKLGFSDPRPAPVPRSRLLWRVAGWFDGGDPLIMSFAGLDFFPPSPSEGWTVAKIPDNMVLVNSDLGHPGVWLVRPAVPEPTSLALFGLGLVGLGFSRRKKA